MSELQVATYFSSNSKPEESWAGCCVLSSGVRLGIWHCAATEEAVIERARKFFAREKARLDQLHGGGSDIDDTVLDRPSVGGGRGSHFAGMVWMIHGETRHKLRVKKDEVEDYSAKGYTRGGPRSK